VDRGEVAAALLASRTAAALTQAALAARIGTTQTAIARAESGTVMPTLDLIERWARACRRTVVLQMGRQAGVEAVGADLATSGVDRDQIRHQMSLTPDARLRGLRNAARFTAAHRPRLRPASNTEPVV
jgi:transcriptional regulator with XRE-family HTH domain